MGSWMKSWVSFLARELVSWLAGIADCWLVSELAGRKAFKDTKLEISKKLALW